MKFDIVGIFKAIAALVMAAAPLIDTIAKRQKDVDDKEMLEQTAGMLTHSGEKLQDFLRPGAKVNKAAVMSVVSEMTGFGNDVMQWLQER